MRGGKPTPTRLRLLRGNPGRRPINRQEPKPKVGTIARPAWLTGFGGAEWARIVPELVRLGVFTIADRALLESYCRHYGRWRELEAAIEAAGLVEAQAKGLVNAAFKQTTLLTRIATEFGFSPASRTRVKADPPPKEDENARFFG